VKYPPFGGGLDDVGRGKGSAALAEDFGSDTALEADVVGTAFDGVGPLGRGETAVGAAVDDALGRGVLDAAAGLLDGRPAATTITTNPATTALVTTAPTSSAGRDQRNVGHIRRRCL
jgi:hypothetical protein